MTRLKTVLQMLFSLPGEILEEVADDNIREDKEFITKLQAAATQHAKDEAPT